MTPYRVAVATLVAVIACAISLSAAYLAATEWFGAGDLRALVLWTAPLAVLEGAWHGWLTRNASSRSAAVHAALSFIGGTAIGIVWCLAALLLLGPWLGALSFPVLVVWVAAAILGSAAAVWLTAPPTRAFVGVVAVLVLAGVGLTYRYALTPDPAVRVVVIANATDDEVAAVWKDVLGAHRAPPYENALLPELAGVTRSGYEDGSVVLTVTFWKSVSRAQRDSIVARIRASPLVLRVVPVTDSDSVGVRRSVSF